MCSTRLTVGCGVGLLSMLLTQCGGAQETMASDDGDWPMYRRDLAGTGYSALAPNHGGERGDPDPGLDLLGRGRGG